MAEARPRPFLDTNVLFSALVNPAGIPGRIVQAHINGDIVIVVSPQVLEELAAAVLRKLLHAAGRLHTNLMLWPPEVCAMPGQTEVDEVRRVVNGADAPILAAAIMASADCLVTGDRGFAAEAEAFGRLEVLTPAAFLARLGTSYT